jgi:hypothetical protein
VKATFNCFKSLLSIFVGPGLVSDILQLQTASKRAPAEPINPGGRSPLPSMAHRLRRRTREKSLSPAESIHQLLAK